MDAAGGCLVSMFVACIALVAAGVAVIYLPLSGNARFIVVLLPVAIAAGVVAWWQRQLRWFGVLGLYVGTAIGYTIYVVMDSESGHAASSHNLFPFEVLAVCVAATVPLGVGALVGQAARTWRDKSRART